MVSGQVFRTEVECLSQHPTDYLWKTEYSGSDACHAILPSLTRGGKQNGMNCPNLGAASWRPPPSTGKACGGFSNMTQLHNCS